MADITMCEGTECSLKDTCHRHTAIPTPGWQSYFVKVPWNKETKTCLEFWSDEGYIRRNNLERHNCS